MVSDACDNSIIIYNEISYKPDSIIKEHKDSISCMAQLSSGELVSCSVDKTIILFSIKDKNYKNLQTLDYHEDMVFYLIELKKNT